MKSDAHADVVTANMRLAEQLGINGTPTVMISAGRGMARMLNSALFQDIQAEVERQLLTLAEGAGDMP